MRGELANKLETLRASQNRDNDVKTALETLKKESGYLFETAAPPPYAAGTGTQPVSGVTRETFDKLGYAKRLELKQSDPKLYDTVKEGT